MMTHHHPLHQHDFLMSPTAGSGNNSGSGNTQQRSQADFENIWTYNAADCDFSQYTDVDDTQVNTELSLTVFDTQDLSLLDPLVMNMKYENMKYENDVIASSDHDVMMAPDSQMQVSTTAPSPYADINQQMSPLSLQTFSSSSPTVPSSTPYSGDYGFAVSVQKQPKETKSATWTHSERLSKLYARIGVAIPFVYRCGSGNSGPRPSPGAPSSGGVLHPPPGTILRVLPVYIRPEHVRDVVRRCPNHAAEAVSVSGVRSNKQVQTAVEAQHLIRSQHSKAKYVEDTCSHRLSVTIPYETPQAGAEWVTTLLEFHCFSSCVGGLNRRPVQLIFTLESPDGSVLGRQAIEVRVCACPGRDRAGDERSSAGCGPSDAVGTHNSANDPGARRVGGNGGRSAGHGDGVTKRTSVAMGETTHGSGEMMAAKRPRDEVDGDVFTLKIRGRRNYDILSTLRDCLELSSLLPPHLADQFRTKQLELGQRLSGVEHLQLQPIAMTSSGIKASKVKASQAASTATTAVSSVSTMSVNRSNAVPACTPMLYQVGTHLISNGNAIFYHQ